MYKNINIRRCLHGPAIIKAGGGFAFSVIKLELEIFD